MKFLRIILITSLIAFYSEAQENEAPPTNLDQLLELVKEGKSKEQAANKKEKKNLNALEIIKQEFYKKKKMSLKDKKTLLMH